MIANQKQQGVGIELNEELMGKGYGGLLLKGVAYGNIFFAADLDWMQTDDTVICLLVSYLCHHGKHYQSGKTSLPLYSIFGG